MGIMCYSPRRVSQFFLMSAAAEPTTPLLVPCRSAKESSEPIVDHSRGDTRPHISPRDSISRIFAYCGFFVTSLVASSAFSTAIQSLSYPAVFGGHKSEVVTSAFYQVGPQSSRAFDRIDLNWIQHDLAF